MTPALSLYLELLRVTATLIVFVSHSGSLYAPLAKSVWLDHLGRDGVIIFFVLSGYVISWCADQRDHDARTYAVNRASRIASVALPALALALAWTLMLFWINGGHDLDYRLRKLWLYLPVYLSFSGNIWYFNETPPNLFPYWSLNFEVWYYVLFALFFYGRGLWRWPVLAALASMLGPSIIQLGALWLAGSLLYFHGGKLRLPKARARVVCVLSALAYVLTKAFSFDDVLDEFNAPLWTWLFGSREHAPEQRLGDYWIGLFVVANVWAARHADWTPGERAASLIRALAARSFSTYLFHVPLFAMLTTLFHDRNSLGQFVVVEVLCISGIALLAQVTEHRKAAWRQFFQHLMSRWPGAGRRAATRA